MFQKLRNSPKPPPLSPELLVANSVLHAAFSKGASMPHLKLQKIIYFVCKKRLQDTGCALFGGFFEVWTYGPVMPSVYQCFKKYGSSNISDYAYSTLDKDKRIFLVSSADAAFHSALEWVWAVYGALDARALVNLTHREGTAWSIADAKESRFIDDLDIMREGWAYG